MNFDIKVHLTYKLAQPCDLLLQINAASMDDQDISDEKLAIQSATITQSISADEAIGQRVWVSAEDLFVCDYSATAEISRTPVDIDVLEKTPLSMLPNDVIKYLMPSRYCHPEDFFDVTSNLFGKTSDGAKIMAMSNWIYKNFAYDPSASNYKTTAADSLNTRKGVCRDYAHVLISMARAVGVPARIVSAYASQATPPDFHAVVEVFLDGAWRLIDPTRMAEAEDVISICFCRY